MQRLKSNNDLVVSKPEHNIETSNILKSETLKGLPRYLFFNYL